MESMAKGDRSGTSQRRTMLLIRGFGGLGGTRIL